MSTTTLPAPDTTGTHQRRALLVGALVLVVLVAGGLVWLLDRGSDDDKVPYDDARSSGTLTLCNPDGKRITSGSVTAAPFVARAVGVTAAADEKGTHATLFAFQPRKGLDPGEWSGKELTSATTFSNAAHPIGQFTVEGPGLDQFTGAYPATWDGLVQLRLYVQSPTFGIAEKYDTVDLRVDGDRWKVVGDAGTAGCSGEATSFETTTLHYKSATR